MKYVTGKQNKRKTNILPMKTLICISKCNLDFQTNTFLLQVKEQLAGENQIFQREWQAEVHQGEARLLILGTSDIVSIFRCEILSFLTKGSKASAGYLFGLV